MISSPTDISADFRFLRRGDSRIARVGAKLTWSALLEGDSPLMWGNVCEADKGDGASACRVTRLREFDVYSIDTDYSSASLTLGTFPCQGRWRRRDIIGAVDG